MVLLSHFVCGFYPALYFSNPLQAHNGYEVFLSKTPFFLLYSGNFAVALFLVLSGFVLSLKFFNQSSDKFHKRIYIIKSAVKRYFRLSIPILASTMIYYFFIRYGLFYNKGAGVITKSANWLVTFWLFSPDLSVAIKGSLYDVFTNGNFFYNASLWMMKYVFWGSALVFAFQLILGKYKLRYVGYLVLIYFTWNTLYINFVFGMILSDIYCQKVFIKNKIVLSSTFLISLFLGSYPTVTKDTIYGFLNLGTKFDYFTFYHSIGAILFMFVLINSELLQKFMSAKALTNIGKISYSMYLVHLAIIGSFSSFAIIKLTKHFSYNVSFLLTFISTIILIYLVSLAFYYLIESNCNRLFNFKMAKIIFKKHKEAQL